MMPSYTNEALACAATAVFCFYWLRMCTLSFRMHDPTFVAQNVLSGTVAGYSAYVLWEYGVYPLPIMASIASALYLLRSRDTFERVTRPAELDEVQVSITHWPTR